MRDLTVGGLVQKKIGTDAVVFYYDESELRTSGSHLQVEAKTDSCT